MWQQHASPKTIAWMARTSLAASQVPHAHIATAGAPRELQNPRKGCWEQPKCWLWPPLTHLEEIPHTNPMCRGVCWGKMQQHEFVPLLFFLWQLQPLLVGTWPKSHIHCPV